MTPRAKIDKATALLLRDYAFWGSLVLNLKVVERTDLPFKTLATDGVHLMYEAGARAVNRLDIPSGPLDVAAFFNNAVCFFMISGDSARWWRKTRRTLRWRR